VSRSGSLPVGRLAAEFAVIVMGVLVALGVDRWVAGIDERDQELAYLAELRTDFVRNHDLAANGARVEGEIADLAVILLESLGTAAPRGDPAQILLAAELTGYVYYSSYAEGAWNDLQAAGSTLLLRDAGLRVAISEFYRDLHWGSELDAEIGVSVTNYRVVSQRFIDPHARLAMAEAFPGWPGFQPLSLLEALDSFDVGALAEPVTAAEELAAPLATAIIAHRARSVTFSEDLPKIDSIVEMIDRALGAL